MPIEAKRDGNVPFIGPQARHNILGKNPGYVTQIMDSGLPFGKQVAKYADNTNQPPDEDGDLDIAVPTVTAGKAVYGPLLEGGWFRMLSNLKASIEILALEGTAGSWEIHDTAALTAEVDGGDPSTPVRPTPTEFPFVLSPSESLVALGGTAGTASVLCKLAGDAIL